MDGARVELSPKEYGLLFYQLSNRNIALTRGDLSPTSGDLRFLRRRDSDAGHPSSSCTKKARPIQQIYHHLTEVGYRFLKPAAVPGSVWRVLGSFALFTAIILAILWILQISLLDPFYGPSKSGNSAHGLGCSLNRSTAIPGRYRGGDRPAKRNQYPDHERLLGKPSPAQRPRRTASSITAGRSSTPLFMRKPGQRHPVRATTP